MKRSTVVFFVLLLACIFSRPVFALGGEAAGKTSAEIEYSQTMEKIYGAVAGLFLVVGIFAVWTGRWYDRRLAALDKTRKEKGSEKMRDENLEKFSSGRLKNPRSTTEVFGFIRNTPVLQALYEQNGSVEVPCTLVIPAQGTEFDNMECNFNAIVSRESHLVYVRFDGEGRSIAWDNRVRHAVKFVLPRKLDKAIAVGQ